MLGSWQAIGLQPGRPCPHPRLALCRGSTLQPPWGTLSEANEVWLQCLSVVLASLSSPNQKRSACCLRMGGFPLGPLSRGGGGQAGRACQ